jgi:hypothetical protein
VAGNQAIVGGGYRTDTFLAFKPAQGWFSPSRLFICHQEEKGVHMENTIQQDDMVLAEDALQKLPPFVAAMVRDYCNGNEEQRWTLRDVEFDLQSLDTLPLREDTTCEIWTDGWVWRGAHSQGTLSPSPHIVRPDTRPIPEVFAWIVEREMKSPQHLTVWRVRIRRAEQGA